MAHLLHPLHSLATSPIARALAVAAGVAACWLAFAEPPAAKTRSAELLGAEPSGAVAVDSTDDGPLEVYKRSHAVVIGIDQYQNLPQLGGAVRDAQEVAESLKEQGFSVSLLLNAQATRAAITKLVGDQLPGQVGPQDRVLVYFAGHGLSRGEGESAMGYLMPVEAQRDAPASTAISMAELQRWFAQYPAKHVLYMADACYSGLSIGTRAVGLSPETKHYLREITQRPVRVALTAGSSGQEAHEHMGHGLFTYFFLQGLGGAADGNSDGVVTTDELAAFIKPNVASVAASQYRAQQHPQFARMGEGEFVFVSAHTRKQSPPSAPQAAEGSQAPVRSVQAPAEPAKPAPARAVKQPIRAALLYFDYEGQVADLVPMRKGLAQMLISDLQGQPGVLLVERERLEEVLAELKLQRGRAVDPATAAKVGKLLGAQYLVLGRISDFMGKLRIDARVVHVETGALVKTARADGKLEDFLDIEQSLAGNLREGLQSVRPPEAPPAPKVSQKAPRKIRPEVLVAYSQALDARDRGAVDEARQLLRKALELDPQFAPADDAMRHLPPAVGLQNGGVPCTIRC
ncbi:MAG: caspase family protein [Deltaproteobacteria bacterium]|nr:caspase family protein [Deltaproteobacteria bacterium]